MTNLALFFHPKKLSLKLMRVVFIIYLSVTFVVTAAHFFAEYDRTQSSIVAELQELEKTVHKSFETSLWQLSYPQLKALSQGLVGMPIVEGIDVIDPHEKTIVSMRDFVSDVKPFSVFYIDKTLQWVLNDQVIPLGTIRLYSSSNIIFDRVLFGFSMIALTAIVKFSVLWVLFLLAFHRFLAVPLEKLMSQVDTVHLEHIGDKRIDLGVTDQNELHQLQDRFNVMLDTLDRDRKTMLQAERERQDWLEKEVASRTEELVEANKRLLELSETDSLTGIRNRRSFFSQSQTLLDLSVRQKQPLCFLLLDLDHFKSINDQYGHMVGDKVLCQFTKIASTQLRKTDVLGRVGGEEFAVCLPDTALDGGHLLATKICQAVAQNPFEFDALCIDLTVSIGLVVRTDEDTEVSQLFQKSDAKLYQAKANGRNCVEL